MLHVIESRASCGTIREYGRECLEETGEAAALQRQHATYYLALALDAELAVTAAAQAVWLTRLEDEDGNLRAALQWAQESGDTAPGLRLAGALRRFWVLHGYLSEGRAWLEWLLTRGGTATISASVRAK